MVLVTGGAGYIGSHTLIELMTQNYETIVVDNLSGADGSALHAIEKITQRSVVHYNVDLCNLNEVEQIFNKHQIRAVVHFAAHKLVAESVEDPAKYYHNNLNSLLNTLMLCVKYNVHEFVFSSSCSVYGNATQLPVHEDSPLGQAQSPYAATKQMGEQMVKDFCARYSLKALLLRYFNPVGAHPSGLLGEQPLGKPQNLVPALVQFAAGQLNEFKVYGTDYPTPDGSCVRDFVHVCDIAQAHVLALNYLSAINDDHFCDVVNLGSGQGNTVLEVVQALELELGRKLALTYAGRRPGDVVEIYANNHKAKSLLNWHPQYSLKDMMKTAWQWQLNNSTRST